MEFIFELLISFFLEGSFGVVQEKKIPKWIRTIVLIIITMLYSVFIIVLIVISANSNNVWLEWITKVLSVLFLMVFIRFWIRLVKEHHRNT